MQTVHPRFRRNRGIVLINDHGSEAYIFCFTTLDTVENVERFGDCCRSKNMALSILLDGINLQGQEVDWVKIGRIATRVFKESGLECSADDTNDTKRMRHHLARMDDLAARCVARDYEIWFTYTMYCLSKKEVAEQFDIEGTEVVAAIRRVEKVKSTQNKSEIGSLF